MLCFGLKFEVALWPKKQIHLIAVLFCVSLFIFCCTEYSYTCRLFAQYGVVVANQLGILVAAEFCSIPQTRVKEKFVNISGTVPIHVISKLHSYLWSPDDWFGMIKADNLKAYNLRILYYKVTSNKSNEKDNIFPIRYSIISCDEVTYYLTVPYHILRFCCAKS